MNRENYDRKVLSTFSIVGCYFVDYYYNTLYQNSKKVLEKYSRSSLTDEYKKAVQVFREECERDKKRYTNVVTRLHQYYQMTTRLSNILLSDFQNKILSHFLPEEHYQYMSEHDKSYFLRKIIMDIIKDFTIYVSKIETLTQVIDDHGNRQNVDNWINRITDIQIRIREDIWQKFITKGQMQTINIESFNRLQEDRDKLWDALQLKMAEILQLKDELSNARKIVEHFSLENTKLESQITSKQPLFHGARRVASTASTASTADTTRDSSPSSSESGESDRETASRREVNESPRKRRRGRPAKPKPEIVPMRRRNVPHVETPVKTTPVETPVKTTPVEAPVETVETDVTSHVDVFDSIP